MRRILTVITVALVMAAMMVGSALPAFADHLPIEACQGGIISGLATSKAEEGPWTPPKVAENGGYSVGDYTKRVRDGKTYIVYPNGETYRCPPPEDESNG